MSTTTTALDNLKLYYWIGARGELVRLILEDANIKYENIPILQADWPPQKATLTDILYSTTLPYIITP